MIDLRTYYRGSLRERISALEALREGLARREPESMEVARQIAHSLKGTGTSYGFPQVTEAGRAALQAVDADLGAATDKLLETLRRVVSSADDPTAAREGRP